MPVQRWVTISGVEQIPGLRRALVAFAEDHGSTVLAVFGVVPPA
jgi:hypothetical protein